ncbi:acidic leucine-rich nuclear phosphoprotein 32 family member B-like [Paramacrobiotus metropolitanus]|uniref:acidic leucine-rich nuclear phosphoprotein 32 family member B-like n=1 Tax=Paramacrobiotus metropolitanus TaxID=2943436 RepID=UPI002445DA9A|nr:acidic leucine-rich nuclear phosphoprotein 32 family member B-like [Paramacrobiotus metropolitanus]
MFRTPVYTTINMYGYLWDQPADTKTIILDEFPLADFRDIPLTRFTDLQCLSANACGVSSLLGLTPLPNLTYLQLNDNLLGYSTNPHFEILATATPNLKRLTLAHNGISTVDFLEPLKNLPALHTVDLFRNSVNRTHSSELIRVIPQVMRWTGEDGDVESESDEEMNEPESDHGEDDEDDDASMAGSDRTWLLSDDDVDHISDSASDVDESASDKDADKIPDSASEPDGDRQDSDDDVIMLN